MTRPSASSSNPPRNEPSASSRPSGSSTASNRVTVVAASGVHGRSSVGVVPAAAYNHNHSQTTHPGTSGRSPPPPRMTTTTTMMTTASSSSGGRGGGRLSVGSTSTTSGASIPSSAAAATGSGTGSYGGGSSSRLPPGRVSGTSAIMGTRLSYTGGGIGPSAADDAAGMIPAMNNTTTTTTTTTNIIRTPTQYHYQQQQLRQQQQQQHISSPPSTTSTQHTATDYLDDASNAHYSQSDFLAALSPSTANFLRRGQRSDDANGGNGNDNNINDNNDNIHLDIIAKETTTTTTMKCNNNHVLSPSSAASLAAENAVRTAANAARGIDNAKNDDDEHHPADIDMMDDDHDDGEEFDTDPTLIIDGEEKTNQNHNNNDGRNHPKTNNNNSIVDKDDTSQLRQFVQSLLGMQLPASSSSPPSSSSSSSSSGGDGGGRGFNSSHSTMMMMMSNLTMITPDPTSAAFFAISLLTKTAYSLSSSSSSSVNANSYVDASVGGDEDGSLKTKYWRPDDAYLAARALSLGGEDKRAIYILEKAGLIGFGMEGGGSSGGGDHLGWELEEGNGERQSETTTTTNPISNRQGVRNALLLRAESALLAGQCLVRAGEYDRASMVYEEAMRYPPPPPPSHWGVYGYGYRLDDVRRKNGGGIGRSSNSTINVNDNMEDEERREDEDFDALLADRTYLRSWREQSFSHAALIDDGDDIRLLQLAASILPLPFSEASKSGSNNIMAGGIHPMARLCAARGIAFDAMSNPHRAISFLKAALTIDARCMEALDHVIKRRLLSPEEEREWISGLNFGADDLGSMGISWLRDAYLSRLRGIGGVVAATKLPPTSLRESACEGATNVSPVPRMDMLSPSVLSIGSPDFAAGAVMGDDRNQAPTGSFPPPNELVELAGKTTSLSRTIDESFHNLAIVHNLGHSPDVLAHAAIRTYALHDLQSALAYCTAIDTIDPYCRTAGYVHVATLVGLNLKRRLFQLAHRLVDTDPKDALAWFAVGSYYYACRRYDLAQRHFSRSTRLDPSSAECWIGFGCSFAVCDESDQALASFRAAQNNYAGSHVPLLYMGMEYLRTNHLSLAGHFLNAAQRTDPYDMLCCNELGVWSYRQGDLQDASFWFLKALRLQLRAEGSSSLNSVDEGLGMNGFLLLSGKHAKKRGVASSDHYGDGNTEPNHSADAITSVTPYLMRRSSRVEGPPVSTVLCAVKTPSGNSIAASHFSDIHPHGDTDFLSDMECVERCKDPFWEPTIFNLGQSFRKMKRYEDAIICFEKCTSLNPGNYAAYAALGFAKHLGGDVDGAIDTYHKSLSRKPEDNFTSEMLTRALAEAVTYPPSVAMLTTSFLRNDRVVGIGSSLWRESASDVIENDVTMIKMTELHVAVALNKAEEVRTLLSRSLSDIHEVDENGDQPAHIAARLNHVACMIALIEYDARMGRKNHRGLTPLGEARMNGHEAIADLIKENYTINVTEDCQWNRDIEKEIADWHLTWDEKAQKHKWCRRGPMGDLETSGRPPPIDIQRVIHARKNCEKMVVRRIHPKSLISMKQVECDKQRQIVRESLMLLMKNRAKIVEERCATKLQSYWRRVISRSKVEQIRKEVVAVKRIQRRFRCFISRKKERSAIRIQSVIRKALTVTYFEAYNRERLWWYRAIRTLALRAQCLWRGFTARSLFRQMYEMHFLPDPDDTRNFDFWVRCQYEAHPPKAQVGIFAEYTLSGTPRTWEERRIKRRGFFRDVVFYANTITKRASWSKPAGWMSQDHQESNIVRVQQFWRARIAQRRIRTMTKAKRLMEHARVEGPAIMDQDITTLCNYTLYVHAVRHDYDHARDLYYKMLEFMNQRGVDNAFVLYSCAIFGAVTNEEDWEDIKDYVRRAKAADDRMSRRRGNHNNPRQPAKCSYHIATAVFYLQCICSEFDVAKSWHNYALCQMLVHHNLAGARSSFVQAINLSPRDGRIISNFNYLLQSPDFFGDPTRDARGECL